MGITRKRSFHMCDCESFFKQGIEHFKANDYESAIKAFSEAIKPGLKTAKYYNVRGQAYMRNGQYAEAVGDFEKAIELEPDNNYHKRLLADVKKLKDGKTPPDNGSSERNDTLPVKPFQNLGKLISKYNEKSEGEFPRAGEKCVNGKGIPYCHINVSGWPEKVFYEFVDWINGPNEGNVELRLHIETVKYPNLKEHISTYKPEMFGEYRDRVNYQPAQGGRLVILLPYTKGYDTMIDCMHKLIRLTKDGITKHGFH
jgi:tetratricopeptide (TPR) repeat protein